jgi:hypothetical protein
LGRSQLKDSLGKSLLRLHLLRKKLDIMASTCPPGYSSRKHKIGVTVRAYLGKNQVSISKIA